MAFKCLTQIEIKYQHPSTDELGRHPSKSMFYVYRENIRTKTFKFPKDWKMKSTQIST